MSDLPAYEFAKLTGSHCTGQLCPAFSDCSLGQSLFLLNVNVFRQRLNLKLDDFLKVDFKAY